VLAMVAVAAALGGYALLRAGQLDRLHHWPRNLADWFPWLPDGAVIAGEEAALEGDHTLAIKYVCDAGGRGLPVFGAGLSLLASRLREYSAAPETAFGENGNLVAEAGRLLEEGKLDESEARMAELGELAPRHPQLASLRDRIRAHRNDPELAVRQALEEAARLIREGRPERVSEVLARLRAVAPEHPQLAKLEAQARKVLEARDVRLRVRALVDQARKLHIRGELEQALALAEEAVRLTPDDAWALRLRDDLVEQLQKTRRRQGKPPA